MYEEVPGTGFSAGTASLLSEDGFSQMVTFAATQTHNTGFSENMGLSMENLAFGSEDAIANTAFTNGASATSALIMEQNPFGDTYWVEQVNHNHRDSNQLALSFDHSTWNISNIQNYHLQHHHQPLLYPTPRDHHLHLYSLPTTASTSSFVNSSISHENPTTQKTINLQNPTGHGGLVGGSYPNLGPESTDVSSVLHLNPPAHASALRELFQSLPSSDFLLFGGEDDRDFDDNGELKFSRDMSAVGRRGGGRGKGIKQVTNEKQRRVKFSSKFDALRELIPNPTKNDRASVLWDAIEYIRELHRSVDDLTLLVDKKRYEKERFKRQKVEEAAEALEDIQSCNFKPLGEPDHHLHKCIIRSSWLQRKSKDTEVDIRIVEDEVTIKLVQRKKKINCLLYASKALDELELDIQHVAGGHIGDFCSFLFNSKIYEGSSVYASAIANKLIEVMDRSFQAA